MTERGRTGTEFLPPGVRHEKVVTGSTLGLVVPLKGEENPKTVLHTKSHGTKFFVRTSPWKVFDSSLTSVNPVCLVLKTQTRVLTLSRPLSRNTFQ